MAAQGYPVLWRSQPGSWVFNRTLIVSLFLRPPCRPILAVVDRGGVPPWSRAFRRRKVNGDAPAALIQTVRGFGYKLRNS
jgi:hypothetical protein